MMGFLIASGKPSVVRSLCLEEALDFCTATDVSCHPVEIRPSGIQKRIIMGLQLMPGGVNDPVRPYSDKYIFIHGNIFGLLGHENVESLSSNRARRFLASHVRSRGEFWPLSMDGDCSIGVVSANTGDIEIVNDSQGFRRIFYYKDDDLIVVSTRLPLILRLVERDWKLSRQGARVFLAGREPKWPLSAVADVKTLPPVHRLRIRDEEVQITSYWRPAEPKPIQERKEVGKELHRALTLAVRRKVEGKKTVVALSGGYDSTCLSKLAASLDCDITAMSVGYTVDDRKTDTNAYNETQYASHIAKKLGIRFRRSLFGPDDVKEAMNILPRIIDQPGQDPTSYLLMSRVSRDCGYDAIISGMGGDACFTPNEDLDKAIKLLPRLQWISRIPLSIFLGNAAMAILSRTHPLRAELHRAYLQGYPAHSLFELMERCKLSKTINVFKNLLGRSIIEDVNQVASLRATVFEHVIEKASCPHEWHYLFALWANPDEYHADATIAYQGLTPIMPFVEPVVSSILFSQAVHHSLDSREFEMEIFGGIPKELLLPKKSGLCLPCERWCKELLLGDLEDLVGDSDWSGLGLNMMRVSEYVNILKCGKEPLDRAIALFLWRLVMLKRYVKENNLRV